MEPVHQRGEAMTTELETEFEVMIARAGLAIPAESKPALLSAFAELRDQCALLRNAARTAAAEPANIYRLRHRETL